MKKPLPIIAFNLTCYQAEMTKLGVRKGDMAKKARISAGMYSDHLSGRFTHPSIWTVVRFSEAFNLPLEAFITTDKDKRDWYCEQARVTMEHRLKNGSPSAS